MSNKFHVTPTGQVRPCKAEKKPCKYGADLHGGTKAEAEAIRDRKMQEEHGSGLSGVSRSDTTKAEKKVLQTMNKHWSTFNNPQGVTVTFHRDDDDSVTFTATDKDGKTANVTFHGPGDTDFDLHRTDAMLPGGNRALVETWRGVDETTRASLWKNEAPGRRP